MCDCFAQFCRRQIGFLIFTSCWQERGVRKTKQFLVRKKEMASLLSMTQEKPPPEDGNHGWRSKDENWLCKNARCSDNLHFLKWLFQNSFGHIVSYSRLWTTPQFSPVLRMKHSATSPARREQETQVQIIHQYSSCGGWVSVSLWVRHQPWRYLVHICGLLWGKKNLLIWKQATIFT